MIKKIFPIIAVLLVVGCNKSTTWNISLGLSKADNNKQIEPSSRYNYRRLQAVLDSLQLLHPRSTIKPQLDIYGTGKNWFTVNMYVVYNENDNIKGGENSNPRFHSGSIKKWILIHAMNIASVISACSYDRDAYVGIHYLGEDGRVYFTPIINLSLPNPYMGGISVDGGWLPD